MKEPSYLLTRDAAKMAGVSKSTIKNWLRTGEIKARTNKSGYLEIERASLQAAMNARQHPDLITPIEAAELVGAKRHNVYRWIADGKIAGVKLGPHFLRVDRKEVIAYAATLRGRGQ
ncbi:helix-turn-helix domain-containing protein [Rhodococcus hoagii]|nr:helix-turn-helix domain-containing protein [Prescottella equi]